MKDEFTRIIVSDPSAIIIHDIPLLIETESYKNYEVVILVYVDRHTQISRLSQRDTLTRDQAEHLLDIQMPLDHKRTFATHIINNSRTLAITRKQVRELMNYLTKTSP